MEIGEFIARAWESLDPKRFPGPQPVSIERRHFPLLKTQPYVVCEKTDGTRHFLVSTDSGVFIVNRAFHIEPVKIRIPKDTLLDGELVKLKNGRLQFVVHDAVIVRGESLLKFNLKLRLERAKGLVKTIIRTSTAPFDIRIKSMINLEDFATFPSLDSFEYETDGLVFTPVNEPIRMGTHETMFKWKPHERITVDFEVRNGRELFVQERGTLYRESELHTPETFPDGTIVECGYGSTGWFVEKIRADKTYANNRRTYFRTVVNLRENIKLHEFQSL